jgi:hypothetical protein
MPAPALEEDATLRRRLGDWDEAALEPYGPSQVAQAVVSLPNRTPEDAWPAVVPTLRQRAAAECQRAASADHLRQFRWQLESVKRNWTLLLAPLYATTYADDEGHARVLLVHGQTGQIDGEQRGSMKRARRRALIIGIMAAALLAVSLAVAAAGLVFPPLTVVGGIGGLVALLTGAGALVPIARVWQFNRRQERRAEG